MQAVTILHSNAKVDLRIFLNFEIPSNIILIAGDAANAGAHEFILTQNSPVLATLVVWTVF